MSENRPSHSSARPTSDGGYPAELAEWLEQRLGPLELKAERAAIDFLGVNSCEAVAD